ncbi:MAG: MopE-related protein, partial [Flavobacteriales bacterium]
GFGDDATGVETCSQPANTVTIGGDCDDMNDQIYPGAIEICDNLDNNCDGNTDEGFPIITYYEDLDLDGFGSNVTLTSCDSLGAGYSLATGDCNDANDQIYPGAIEVIDNGIDENCDGFDNYAGLTDESMLSLSLIPNPTAGDVTISVSTSEKFDLQIRDVTGKLLVTLTHISNGTTIATNTWAPGTYFVTLSQNDIQVISKLMVK